MERLLEPYSSKKDIVQVATALERLRNTPLDDRVGFFCISHIRNLPWNGGDGKQTVVVPAFYLKDDFMMNFRWETALGEIDIWGEDPEKRSLENVDFIEALVLSAHNINVAGCFWGPGMSSALLAAQVPPGFEDKYGAIGEIFLGAFFRKCNENRKRAFGIQEDEDEEEFTSGREMTPEEMQRTVRDIVVFNRLAVAQDLHQAYQEIEREQKKQMVKSAICDPSQIDMPFVVLTEDSETGKAFLEEIKSEMDPEEYPIVHLTVNEFSRRIHRCLSNKYVILLISDLDQLPDEVEQDTIEDALCKMLEAGRKLVFATSVPVSEIEMDSRLKELISRGLATYIDSEM